MAKVSNYTRARIELLHKQGLLPAEIFRSLKAEGLLVGISRVVHIIKKFKVTGSVANLRSYHDYYPSVGTQAVIGQLCSLVDESHHTSQVGTQLYMSPEQIEGKAYSHKVDIFSLGLIFFELFCPFGTQMERIKVMGDVKRRVIPSNFEAEMPLQSELVRWLLSPTPKARPNATEVKNSGLLKQINLKISENTIHKS